MKKLYLETKYGRVLIDPAVVEKYKLEIGEESPFTHDRIVDKDGDAEKENEPEKVPLEGTKGELVNDGIAEIDNALTLSTSEIIDFAQGTDSSNR